ncbi:LysR family transcriptional regulator [Micromonospora musae]|uniref:LysR family transcriptional regulator n=1 Tax=Micromonospora musae TaxID=1894970 RepID=A0A3A9Y348_9ACTN|nr:LysR family transcriptional regulator [Micromonospora musae]RKN20997.1 LysR family transcriptional regulator [Micromonospora musae]RKN32190.1 LysR family transcriptional regulator [Micromonospora musae]
MELRHLHAFVAVAEERSFSRAATRLRVAQSAVSRTVQALERELGLPLFERSRHYVELTKTGHATLDSARAALAAAEAVRDAARQPCPAACPQPSTTPR